MHRIHRALALAAVLAAATSSVQAQQDAVVVTATRYPSRTSELVSDVTVITRKQIEQAPQATLEGLLQAQPGLQIWTNGGPGSPASLSIRGASPAQTLVLVDGQRLSSATVGTTALQDIPLSQVQRIEILRGPASALYGADAVGGVIQIFTRKGEGAPRVSAQAGVGTYDTQSGWVNYGGRRGATRFDVDFGYKHSGGFSATKPGAYGYNPDRDPFTDRSMSAQVAQQLNADDELGAQLFYSAGRDHFDAENCDPTYTTCTSAFDNYLNETLGSYAVYTRNRLTPGWTSLLRVGTSEDDLTSYYLDPLGGSVSGQNFRTDQDQLSWQNDLALGPGKLLLVFDHLRERVHSNSVAFTVGARSTNSFTAGYHLWFHGNTVQASLRHDDNSQFGGSDTGSVGYGYQFTPAWRASASVGTAFRAPTFDDLYWPVDYSSFYEGNPRLRPERSHSQELRAVYEVPGQRASFTVYHNRVSDLISFGAAPAPAFFVTSVNVGSALLEGATATYTCRLGRWNLGASYDVLRARDENTGLTLARRATRHGTLGLRYAAARWSAGAQLIAVGPRYDDAANTTRLGGFGLVNLDARYKLAKGWAVFARAENVFDKRYELVHGYNTPGATLFLGLRYEPR